MHWSAALERMHWSAAVQWPTGGDYIFPAGEIGRYCEQ